MKLSWMNSSEGFIYIRSAYSFLIASSTEALEHVFMVVLVYLLVCLSIYKLLFATAIRGLPIKLVNNIKFPRFKRVLVVTSHPDDECMFFGPTILSLTQQEGCQVYVLCLSNGNYEQKAKYRRLELWKACSTLGVPSANVTLVNASALPDDPNTEWKVELIAKLINKNVESLDIEAIVTFDRDGVSQHPNHCAIYYATASLCLANLIPKGCKIYTLDSINVVRKYISIFDLICTFLISTHWCILNWRESAIVRRAMNEHKSQMKWYRWLYILFSRYMFINSLREINLSDVELEMQIQDS